MCVRALQTGSWRNFAVTLTKQNELRAAMHASQVISRALHAPLLIRHVVHLLFEINCENCRIRSRALAFGTVAVVRQQ